MQGGANVSWTLVELVLKVWVIYDVFSLLVLFLAHLRGADRGWDDPRALVLQALARSPNQGEDVRSWAAGSGSRPPLRRFHHHNKSSVEARAIRSDCVDMQLSGSFGQVSCRQWPDHLSETSFTRGRSPKTSLRGQGKELSACLRPVRRLGPLSMTFVTDLRS